MKKKKSFSERQLINKIKDLCIDCHFGYLDKYCLKTTCLPKVEELKRIVNEYFQKHKREGK